MSLSETGLKGVTTRKMLAGVMKFLDMNRKLYHKKALLGLVRENRNKSDEIAGSMPYTNAEIKRMLDGTKKLRTKAIIHFFKDTGARPQVFTDPILRMKHLLIQYDENDKDTGCYAIRVYDNSPDGFSENSKAGQWVFLTPEGRKALDAYLNSRKLNGEAFDKETPVFATYPKVGKGRVKNRHLALHGIYDAVELVIKSASIERRKIDERYDKAIFYGFRKRFNTVLKLDGTINSKIAEKLMHHKKGLDGIYLRPTRDECFAEFKKAIIQLIVDDSERDKIKIRKLECEKSELEKSRIEIKEMKKRMDELEYGAKARHASYAENMLKFRREKNRNGEALSMLWHFLFERMGTEEEKRRFLKNARKATENGEKFDMSWFEEFKELHLENLKGINNNS